MQEARIILLTGPTGSGKTDTAWALLAEFPQMVFLDCDWFASRTPFSWKNSNDVEFVFEAIAHQMKFHLERQPSVFVVTLTIEMVQRFETHKHYFEDLGRVQAFRLFCRPQVLESRISARNRIQKADELENAKKHTALFEQLPLPVAAFTPVDTSDRTPAQVAREIVEKLEKKVDQRRS